jgi:PleD family two-component response regulator
VPRGFEVDRAENGVVGLAKVSECPPDLITFDLMMPVMDGWEVPAPVSGPAKLRRHTDPGDVGCTSSPVRLARAL